eukprot:4322171-Prymnesium_polylepis.1
MPRAGHLWKVRQMIPRATSVHCGTLAVRDPGRYGQCAINGGCGLAHGGGQALTARRCGGVRP